MFTRHWFISESLITFLYLGYNVKNARSICSTLPPLMTTCIICTGKTETEYINKLDMKSVFIKPRAQKGAIYILISA